MIRKINFCNSPKKFRVATAFLKIFTKHNFKQFFSPTNTIGYYSKFSSLKYIENVYSFSETFQCLFFLFNSYIFPEIFSYILFTKLNCYGSVSWIFYTCIFLDSLSNLLMGKFVLRILPRNFDNLFCFILFKLLFKSTSGNLSSN